MDKLNIMLSEGEVSKLWSIMSAHCAKLSASGDYPEKAEEKKLLDKILEIKVGLHMNREVHVTLAAEGR